MTTSTDYITSDQFRAYYKDPGNVLNVDNIAAAITAASRKIDAWCGRYFYQNDETQLYFPNDWWTVDLDDMDLATASGLTVSTGDGLSGSYPNVWVYGTDFLLEPVNQSSNGIRPWPYEYIRSIGPQRYFPIRFTPWQQPTVQVVGTFGWPAVPDAIAQACRVIAAQLFKLADAPLGTAGINGWGEVRVQDIPLAASLLQQYRKGSAMGIC
jgi:hypothetical protein